MTSTDSVAVPREVVLTAIKRLRMGVEGPRTANQLEAALATSAPAAEGDKPTQRIYRGAIHPDIEQERWSEPRISIERDATTPPHAGQAEQAWQNIETAEIEFLNNLAEKGGLADPLPGMLRHCARLLASHPARSPVQAGEVVGEIVVAYSNDGGSNGTRISWRPSLYGLPVGTKFYATPQPAQPSEQDAVTAASVWEIVRSYVQPEARGRTFERLQMHFINAAPPLAGQREDAELTPAQIEAGWQSTFSTTNPHCPCDLKSFTKAARWALRQGTRPASAGAVDDDLLAWIEDGDTIPKPIINACRDAICMEFGNNGTDGYYKRILVKVFAALTSQQGDSDGR